jgi:hypothetical protein
VHPVEFRVTGKERAEFVMMELKVVLAKSKET